MRSGARAAHRFSQSVINRLSIGCQSDEPLDDGCRRASVIGAFALSPAFSIQRFLMGARMNFAEMPAAIDTTAAEMNTAFQLPPAESIDAIGTSIEAVP